jgi:hypothetical protein
MAGIKVHVSPDLNSWKELIPKSLVDCFRTNEPPVVFVGAGLGNEAVPPLPTADALCASLRAKLLVENHGEGLSELLQYLKNQEAGSTREVVAWLKKALNYETAEPGGAHHLLAELPIREILTTNYDLLLDDAARACGKALANANSSNDYRTIIAQRRQRTIVVGRLHGAFEHEASIVATTDDYLTAYDTHDWAELFSEFVRSRRLLFLGYSLRDFNIWTTFITALMRAKKDTLPHVMVTPSNSKHLKTFWSKYNIQLVPLRAHEFLIALHDSLGLLEKSHRIAFAAAAACRKVTMETIEEEIRISAEENKVTKLHAALMCVLNGI